jgi:DNA repair protein RadA/Sms
MSYRCDDCGAVHQKWLGKCTCGAWNTLVEEKQKSKIIKKDGAVVEKVDGKISLPERIKTNVAEFDRTIGGGLVAGGVILLAGDPGVGKSTLLLQICNSKFEKGVLYISGEESISQIKLRAKRLGVESEKLMLCASNSLEEILSTIDEYKKEIDLLIIDSIQTIGSENLDSVTGSVGQIRYCAQKLIEFAKLEQIALILIGHVTKDGAIAGPKILEHSVDTVLHFEGERNYAFRLLRSIKNRFGATDEVGIFEILENGLRQVENPSMIFLNQQQKGVTGSIIFPSLEGTRPLLVEIQALVSNSFLQMPRRSVIGWDANRLAMICAVLEKHCKLIFGNKDIYLNVVGGMRVNEPAADLAVALALLSCYFNIPLPNHWVAFGEIGLSGEIRSVQQVQRRMMEAENLGCLGILGPSMKVKGVYTVLNNIKDAHLWIKNLEKQS